MVQPTEHVYLINEKPIAAANVVPESTLEQVLDAKAERSELDAFVTNVRDAGGTTLVDPNTHEAQLNEITDDEISGILAALT